MGKKGESLGEGSWRVFKSKTAQIWIETVLYTLIGLAIIALLLALINPRINQMKDKAIIGQTIDLLNSLDSKLIETLVASGNTRNIGLEIKKGQLVISSLNNSIYYVLENTNLLYSEINQTVKQGDIGVRTIQARGKYEIYLTLNYSFYNITYENKDINKVLSASSSAYNVLIENYGGNDKKINIRLVG